MLAIIESASVLGVNGQRVNVEVHCSAGLPGFAVVGLPDTSCKESRDRVRSAILSSKFQWPMKRITVNLAPSSVRKIGAGLDLAMAIGILVASEQITRQQSDNRAYLGELGLDGSIRKIPGIVSMVDALNSDEVIVPIDGYEEASLISNKKIKAAGNLGELIACLQKKQEFPSPAPKKTSPPVFDVDIADIKGQEMAKKALEISAAGGHNLLMVGPPGSGKSMLAKRLPTLLPEMSEKTSLETTRIHSVAGHLHAGTGIITRPPFRAPHHTMSSVALTGGGSSWIKPGEISAAHGGVLFLDEIAEFSTVVLDALRQPLEEGEIRISRSAGTVSMPANFLLVGAMNPCPCGKAGTLQGCCCTQASKAKYTRRISGPLLDRFDLSIFVSRPSPLELLSQSTGETSAQVKERVLTARSRAEQRGVGCNSELSASALKEYAKLSQDGSKMIENALALGNLSARGADKIRGVSLTLADLAQSDPPIKKELVALALQLRQEPFQQNLELTYSQNAQTA